MRSEIPQDAAVYGLSQKQKQELIRVFGAMEAAVLVVFVRLLMLPELDRTGWVFFWVCIGMLLFVPFAYFATAMEKTAIRGSEVWMMRLLLPPKHFDLREVTGYRKGTVSSGRYAPRRSSLRLHKGIKKLADVALVCGGEEIAAWLRAHRCPPQFPEGDGPAYFEVGWFLRVENGMLCRGDHTCPIPHVQYHNGVLCGPDGTHFGRVSEETKNADLLAWYLQVNGFDLTGTPLQSLLL